MNFYIELILRVCIFMLFLRGSANATCYSIVSHIELFFDNRKLILFLQHKFYGDKLR